MVLFCLVLFCFLISQFQKRVTCFRSSSGPPRFAGDPLLRGPLGYSDFGGSNGRPAEIDAAEHDGERHGKPPLRSKERSKGLKAKNIATNGAPGIAISNKDATRGSWPYY